MIIPADNLLFDVHTHLPPPAGIVAIMNLRIQSHFVEIPAPSALFSAGIHPWDTGSVNDEWVSELTRIASDQSCVAIGECGVDTLKGASVPRQLEIFERHIRLSAETLKPLLIHSVRSQDLMIGLKKKYPETPPWIMHGFNKGADLLEKIISANIFPSFGAEILEENSKAAHALAKVKPQVFFLETDDGNKDILGIYEAAAALINTDKATLIRNIADNFQKVFRS